MQLITQESGWKASMTKLQVNVCEETGVTSVCNDGNWIPIEIHEEENIYIGELIFGHLLSGSNYNDEEEGYLGGMIRN